MNKGTRQRFFRHSLVYQTLTMLLPLLLFSAAVITVVARSTTQEANRQNAATLTQMQRNFESVLNQLDVLVLGLEGDGNISALLRGAMADGDADGTRAEALGLIHGFVSSVAKANPYIDSIYVYLNNPNNWVLTSSDGFTQLADQLDVDWYQSYLDHRESLQHWTERRALPRYKFQKINPPEAVSLYRSLGDGEGVIVVNMLSILMQQQLSDMCEYEGQVLLILNERDEIMFLSHPKEKERLSLMLTSARVRSGEDKEYSQRGLRVAFSRSAKYGLRFLSLTPESSLYALSNQLIRLSVIILSGAALLGIVLAYQYGHRNHRSLMHLHDSFFAALNNQPLPPLPERSQDEYGYIVQNMLGAFLQQMNLAMRLEQENLRLMSMELFALQSQINPHFLVNTLRTIFWKSMALTGGEMNGVSEMLENLTWLLDFSMGSPKETVTLAQELEATRSYVEIQRIRHQESIEMAYDVPSALLDAPMLKLLLQPLVENAITHGISPDKGHIRITIRVKANAKRLMFSVQDDGQGIPRERLDSIRKQLERDDAFSAHIGLYNTNKRIQLFYKQSEGLKIHSVPGEGTRISFSLPFAE